MAAALVQPALSTMSTHFELQMDTDSMDTTHENESNIQSEEEAKSDTELPALASGIESESDEEIQATLKRMKKGKKFKKKVLADDSDDDSMEDQSYQNEESGNAGKDKISGNESDEEDIGRDSMVDDKSDNEGNSFTKVHKKRARVLEDDSDDQDHIEKEEIETSKNIAKRSVKKDKKSRYSDSTGKSRRKEKEEIGKRSGRGNAMKQLLKSRKKKSLKTFKEEDSATSSDSEEEASKTKSKKKGKLKTKYQNADVPLKVDDSSKSELDSDKELIQNSRDETDNIRRTKKIVNGDKEKSDIENTDENQNLEKEESELSSCGSSIEDDIEQTNFKKSYGTRQKSAAKRAVDSEDEIDKAQQLKTNKILENTDLFEAESGDSGDDNLKQNSDIEEEDLSSGNRKNEGKKKKVKESRPRKPKKSELFESQSNQQKLLREQSVSIPEHRPAEVSIHQFLQRVPALSSKRKSIGKKYDAKDTVPIASKTESVDQNKKNNSNLQDNGKKLPLSTLPILSADVDDVVLELEDEDKKENAGMSLLMKRLAKHTALPKHKQLQKKAQPEEIEIVVSELEATQVSKKKSVIDVEKIKMAAEIPGSGLLELKSQLQKRMKVVREVNRKEAEVRHKLENEDFDDEEEEWDDEGDAEEDSSDNDDVIEDNSKQRSSKNVEKNRESEDEDDDEIRKWNEEDERKQIENQLDEMEEIDRKLENSSLNRSNILRVNASHDENTTASARTATSSLDLFPGVNDEDESRADHSFNLELKDTLQWDETSTIPPGQGELSKPSDKSRLEASTPFSKLLYGTRRYSSTSDENSRIIHEDEFATKESQFKMDTDESSRVGPILSDDIHFTLDENTQFSQILDTQGYINPRKPSKEKLAPKTLLSSEDPSMTQLLGLCSGNFEKDKSKSINMNVDDFGLPSDLPCDDSKTDGNSQEILDLCTGKFETPAARTESPLKKGSVLEKLLNQSDAVTSDSQIINLCSGTFSSAVESRVYGEPLIEESKSAGSLMKHFGEPKMDSYARKSFDNLFTADKRSTGTDETKLGSLDDGGLIMNGNESDVDPELLELCTGNFAQTGQEKCEATKSPMFYIGKKRKDSIADDGNGPEYVSNQKTEEIEDEEESEEASENETDREDLPEGADGDASNDDAGPDHKYDRSLASSDERQGSDGDEEEIDEELQEYYEAVPSKKFSKKRFYEEEAELSGSDVGDDDDEDLGSEADEYEIDSDIEDLPSDARIRAQVHKAHMKATLEDDRQDIRRIQERFYEDGDLLSDGVGRRRNFRWRNIDRPLNDTFESVGSDNEDLDENENEPEGHTETEKRIARLEREAFLEEQRKTQETVILDEDSQSILNIIKDRRTTQETNAPVKPTSQKNSVPFKRQGSFLDRSKTTLSRLSSLTSNRSKTNAPTRSFVYQSKSSNSTPEGPDASKKIRRPLPNTEPPRPKKARIDRTLSQPTGSSIFSHL